MMVFRQDWIFVTMVFAVPWALVLALALHRIPVSKLNHPPIARIASNRRTEP